MKISCEKNLLNNALLKVQKAVATKSCLPALEGFYIKTNEDSITVCGYNLELGILTKIPAVIEEQGQIVLSSKIFFEIIKKAPSDTVTIATDENFKTIVQSNPAKFSIIGISADDYPELPVLEQEEKISINSQTLKSMIRQTIFAIADTDTKPVNMGTLFDFNEDILTLVSTDGYRLALRKEKLPNISDSKFVVPGKSLAEILKLLPDDDKNVDISIGKKHIIFNIENYRVISRLLEGDFLDYKSAVPTKYTTEIVVNTKDLVESVDRVSLIVNDRLKSPVKCNFEDNCAKLSCNTAIGKAKDEISVEIQGEKLEIGFNSKYLTDALKNSECDKVKIQVNGSLSPMKITPLEGDSFIFLVLPVRLQAD